MGIQRGGAGHWVGRSIVALVVLSTTANAVVADQSLEELARRVGVLILADATSDKDLLSYTKGRMPFQRMSVGARTRAQQILGDISQYRRMPSLQYPVDPNIYQYLVNHPDVAVATWRAMGISKLQMNQTDEFSYEASAGDGSAGTADVLWRDGNQCMFVVEGEYHSPILPKAIRASALVWLQYRFVTNAAGQKLVNQQVETFIYFPSMTIETIAKMATRVTNTILDRNVFEVSLYARMMSEAAQKDPEWIVQVANRMDGVAARRRDELIRVSRGINPTSATTYFSPKTSPAQIRNSGQFRTFESSLNQLNNHVPLAAGEIEHRPSYGQRIGAASPLISEPHRVISPEAQKAIAAEQERKRRMASYNALYAKPGTVPVPKPVEQNADPTRMHATKTAVGELMEAAPPVVFSGKTPSGYAKASSATRKTTAPRKTASKPASVKAQPVSRSKVVEEKPTMDADQVEPLPVPPAL